MSLVTVMMLTLCHNDYGAERFKMLMTEGFGLFDHQHSLTLDISVGHKYPKDVTKIFILLPTF